MRPIQLSCLWLIALVGPLSGQGCPNGETFWKRDTLPVNPTSLSSVRVIQRLCVGEAGGVVFNIPAAMPPQKITRVVAPWGSIFLANVTTAQLDVEIYDGVYLAGGPAYMGTLVFRLSDHGTTMPVSTHALNTLDVSAYDIIVGLAPGTSVPPARRFAVCFRVVSNQASGSCTNWWQADLFTDYNQVFPSSCNYLLTPTWVSVIWLQSQGFWQDAAFAWVPTPAGSLQYCPSSYSGIWCIRCCTVNPNQVNVLSPLPATAPTTVLLQFLAPGQSGRPYLAAASFGNSPGIPTSLGTIPLVVDDLLSYSLLFPSGPHFFGFQGQIGPNGEGSGSIDIPAGLGAWSFYTAFVAVAPSGSWTISNARFIPVN